MSSVANRYTVGIGVLNGNNLVGYGMGFGSQSGMYFFQLYLTASQGTNYEMDLSYKGEAPYQITPCAIVF